MAVARSSSCSSTSRRRKGCHNTASCSTSASVASRRITEDRLIRRPPGHEEAALSGPPVSAAVGRLRSVTPTCPRSPVITGFGTVVNVCTVLIGSSVGVLAGNRLPPRTRDLVTDALGLVTLLIAGLAAVAVNDPALAAKVGPHAPLLIVLGSLVIGGIVGSLLRLGGRGGGVGGGVQGRAGGGGGAAPAGRRLRGGGGPP